MFSLGMGSFVLFVEVFRYEKGGRRDQRGSLMRAHVILIGQNRPCHLVQQRRGARLEVAVVVIQGDAALVGEEDHDARPVHVPAAGTGRQPAQRLGWWFRGGESGDWLVACCCEGHTGEKAYLRHGAPG